MVATIVPEQEILDKDVEMEGAPLTTPLPKDAQPDTMVIGQVADEAQMGDIAGPGAEAPETDVAEAMAEAHCPWQDEVLDQVVSDPGQNPWEVGLGRRVIGLPDDVEAPQLMDACVQQTWLTGSYTMSGQCWPAW